MHGHNVTIAQDGDTSTPVDVWGQRVVGIAMSAAWTAGNITFEASWNPDAGTPVWGAVVDTDGGPVTVTAPAAGEWVMIPIDLLAGVRYLRLVSSVSQEAARTLVVVTRPVV
ncbi:MAG: hypothetical protein AB7G37_06280 [Solirubrobacteraceae bacterium]